MKNTKVITKESIADVKKQAPIVDLIDSDVGLDDVGGYFAGPSPFLPSMSRSLCVNAEAGRFRCVATGKRGDSIDYMRLRFRMGFVEAVEALAERYEIEIHYENEKKGLEPIPQFELPMSFVESGYRSRLSRRSA